MIHLVNSIIIKAIVYNFYVYKKPVNMFKEAEGWIHNYLFKEKYLENLYCDY